MVELRKHPRYETQIPAQADVFGKPVPVSITEISFAGLRFRTTKFIPPDTLVAVSITKGRHITFNGWVVWVMDHFMPDGQVYDTGIQINAVIDAANRLIETDEREALIQEVAHRKTTDA